MDGRREVTGFEVAIVVPKKREKERDDTADCVEFLVRELERAGLIVERVHGISDEFIKFWKRKNSALLARWGINYTLSEYKAVQIAQSSFSHVHDKCETRFGDEPIEKKILQRDEWLGLLLRIRNNAIIVLAIICLQLPFELAYAHLYEVTESDVLK
ncbi:hypothetical protein BHE74_00005118 [Ensete ventricosum]|uniref:Uncharacterized protein n=1 Tax=Ensete ventricosum TaxID=4639 RepID=A0A427B3A6_ENSVE|nr:hypothetical protein B296_00002368 [Ensete ventricosum]RWW86131.1 hypothetical protein BHE74_00005118 [Ensete ventricosum]